MNLPLNPIDGCEYRPKCLSLARFKVISNQLENRRGPQEGTFIRAGYEIWIFIYMGGIVSAKSSKEYY